MLNKICLMIFVCKFGVLQMYEHKSFGECVVKLINYKVVDCAL